MNDIDHLKDELRKALLEINELRAERRWIPVEERLPEVKLKVLAVEEQDQFIHLNTLRVNGEWEYMLHVTHWMPLPPLPQEEVQG